MTLVIKVVLVIGICIAIGIGILLFKSFKHVTTSPPVSILHEDVVGVTYKARYGFYIEELDPDTIDDRWLPYFENLSQGKKIFMVGPNQKNNDPTNITFEQDSRFILKSGAMLPQFNGASYKYNLVPVDTDLDGFFFYGPYSHLSEEEASKFEKTELFEMVK